MNLSQLTRFGLLLSRVKKEAISTNQGSLFIAASRTMATSEVGSGASKGGGSGGRLVSIAVVI
jgi:hypothetical protein